MKLGELLAEERELMFRSLALSGVHVVVSLEGLKVSEQDLAGQEVKEIHVMDPVQLITDRLEELGFKFKGIVKGWKVFAPSHLVLHSHGFEGSFKLGDIVQLNLFFGKRSHAGTMAFVDESKEGRIHVITELDDEFYLQEREQIDHLIYISSNNKFLDFFRDSKA